LTRYIYEIRIGISISRANYTTLAQRTLEPPHPISMTHEHQALGRGEQTKMKMEGMKRRGAADEGLNVFSYA